MRLLFSASDFGATCCMPLPAPLLEMKFAARALRHGIDTPWGDLWRRRALARFPITSSPGRCVVSHFSWALSPTVLAPDFEDGMDTIRALSPLQARAELAIFERGPTEGAGAPPYLRHAITGDREATQLLSRATSAAYSAVLQPYWSQVRAHHHAELVRIGRLIGHLGVRAALTRIVPGARWNGDYLHVDGPQHRTVVLRGRGLLLIPTVFWAGVPLVGELGEHPVVLAYPSASALTIGGSGEADPLCAILGSTKAAVLRALTVERSTSELAHHLGISVASASEHAATLRRARLTSSDRCGKAVVHYATALGLDLLDANGH